MNILIQEIVSDYSPIPLAQIRTDGNKVEWINDSEKLQNAVGDDYQALKDFIKAHAHLTLTSPSKPVALRNIVLENLDNISITDDGATVFLNGRLLTIPQKKELQSLLDSGTIKVKGQGAPQIFKKPVEQKKEESTEKGSYKDIRLPEPTVEDPKASVYHDAELEKIEDDVVKNLMYYSKYKKFKGGADAY